MTGKYVVLCYHRVGTGGVPYYCQLLARAFEEQVKHVCTNYRVVSLQQMLQELCEDRKPPGGVVFTFDDGYRGTYAEAFPILRKYRIPATIYLSAGAIETGETLWYDRIFVALHACPTGILHVDIDGPGAWRIDSPQSRLQAAAAIVNRMRRLPNRARKQAQEELERGLSLPANELAGHMLTWEQAREMRNSGISFGGHTMTHPVVSRLAPEDLGGELFHSKQLIEQRLQMAVRDFAFPFGSIDECGTEAVRALTEFGYQSAVTTVQGANDRDADILLLRRVGIDQKPIGTFAFKLLQSFLEPARERVVLDESQRDHGAVVLGGMR